MGRWLKSQWVAFGASYDAPAAAVQSSPGAILLGPGLVIVAILVLHLVPRFAGVAQLRAPLLPVLLFAFGGLASHLAWRTGATGGVGTACMLIDTALYCGGFATAAVLASPSFGIGFAVAYGLFVLAFPARVYSLTLPVALAICVPPLAALLALGGRAPESMVMWAGATLALVSSYRLGMRRTLERQNERLRTALGAADQVAAQSLELAVAATLVDIGTFLHELRNTRAAGGANLHYLLSKAALDGEARAALEDIGRAHEEEDRLVAKLVADLRRKGKPATSTFAVQQLVERLLAEASPPPALRFVDEAPGFVVHGNPEHLQVALANLVRNAGQAGASRVELRLASDPSARSVELEVADDGPGLPDAIRRDPFQPFSRVHRGGGLGLGLYLSRRYVEMMGGRIEVGDANGHGTTFRLQLPARRADVGAPAPSRRPATAA